MKKNKKEIVFSLIKIFLLLLFVFSFGGFGYFLLKLNILPTKYLIGGICIFCLIFLFISITFFCKGKIILKGIVLFFLVLLSGSFIFGTKYLITTYSFFENAKAKQDTISYSVFVLKNSNFNSIQDLKENTILYLEDIYNEEIEKAIANQISFRKEVHNEFGTILDKLLNKEVSAIVLEESYILFAKEEMEHFEENFKEIYSFSIQIQAHKEAIEENDIHISLEPFILYISGIDQRGNINNSRGRSDVNQLMVINPKTNQILLVNTPRDYYVQLAGTTGLRDKLTHAGIYGIEKSIQTLENLYSIDISYYLRVNFNTIEKLVDVIGGIEVESDQAFQSSFIKDWQVQKGINSLDGKKALAYSRERYAYTTGDNHRGANQQQVITAIINKVTKSNVLISKYNSILKALEGSFTTDMSTNEITSFIKYQLDKMPSWTIESYAVTGSGSMDYTYSMGMKYKLYVMEPNQSSIETAKKKINEVLNEK